MEICSILLCGLLIASGVLSSAVDGKHIRFQQFISLLRVAFNSLIFETTKREFRVHFSHYKTQLLSKNFSFDFKCSGITASTSQLVN